MGSTPIWVTIAVAAITAFSAFGCAFMAGKFNVKSTIKQAELKDKREDRLLQLKRIEELYILFDELDYEIKKIVSDIISAMKNNSITPLLGEGTKQRTINKINMIISIHVCILNDDRKILNKKYEKFINECDLIQKALFFANVKFNDDLRQETIEHINIFLNPCIEQIDKLQKRTVNLVDADSLLPQKVKK